MTAAVLRRSTPSCAVRRCPARGRRRGHRRGAAAGLAAALLLAVLPAHALAHGLEPAFLSLSETAPGRFAVLWRSSALRLPGAQVAPRLPEHCRQATAPRAVDEGDRVRAEWEVDCGAAGLIGATVAVDDLDVAAIAALVRIAPRDGAPVERILTARAPALVVPRQPSGWDVLRDYGALGVEHILSGPDHLLFVIGLLLLVAPRRQLLATITAFTLGHSITLSAAALQLFTLPSRPVEVLIAASVLWLAVELARDGGAHAWLRRAPWSMALLFGLLHGFGFAGALAETGLPAGDIPLALLGFNLGIELGQLAVVAAALAAAAGLARVQPRALALGRGPAVYAMGILAAFWGIERTAAWWG